MKYRIVTLGCKVNQYETNAIEALLTAHGHEPAPSGAADVVIVNSCAVTAESGRKSRQALRREMSENPGALGVICGCWPQVSPEEARELGADVVCGSGDRHGLIEKIETALYSRQPVFNIDDPFKRRVFEPLPAGAFSGHARAYLKIQDGCDNFCSYCIIPYARGAVRSVPPELAAAEAARLQSEGYREIVITGIEIASYGKDLHGPRLADAVEHIAAAAPETRLRLGSLEPTCVTENFCARLAATGRVCDHFHLSMQSGCDATLRRMNRKYDTARYLRSAELLRQAFPGCGLTTDLITGFPGETDAEFADTLGFVERCAFSAMHVFPYSVRPGTRAAAMPEQVPKSLRESRAARARALASEMEDAYLASCVGRVIPVLFEHDGEDASSGHGDNYCEVSVPAGSLRGLVKNVEIAGVSGKMLVGKIL